MERANKFEPLKATTAVVTAALLMTAGPVSELRGKMARVFGNHGKDEIPEAPENLAVMAQPVQIPPVQPQPTDQPIPPAQLATRKEKEGEKTKDAITLSGDRAKARQSIKPQTRCGKPGRSGKFAALKGPWSIAG